MIIHELDKMVEEICENTFFMDDDLVKEKNRDENRLYISFSKLKKILFSYLMHDDGWIPVEKELPEEENPVLVQIERYDKDLDMTLKDMDVMQLHDADNQIFESINRIPSGKIVSWRPLPEQYQPERTTQRPEWKGRMLHTFLGGHT